MKRQPLVSAIINFYNAGEEFFIEAIESILAQTYDNWELLLADDGSTDESTAIAFRYAKQYPEKVRYLEHNQHQNRGMSATRNLGIRHAKGEYIAFLDADDVWLPNKLEEQVPIIEAHPEVAMLYGRTQYWLSWTENNPFIEGFKQYLQIPRNLEDNQTDFLTITSKEFDRKIEPPTQLILYLQDRRIYPCTCSILIRRRVFENIGVFEENFPNGNEDMVFHSKVFLQAPVYISSQIWDRYRIHPNSYWRTADRQGIGGEVRDKGRLNYLNWLEAYLSEQNINDIEVYKALKKALFPYRHPRLHRLSYRVRHPLRSLSNFFNKIENRVRDYGLKKSKLI